MKPTRSVHELPGFAGQGELIAFALVVVVATSHDLGFNIIAFGEGDDVVRDLLVHVDSHAVTRVEHLVHLFMKTGAGLVIPWMYLLNGHPWWNVLSRYGIGFSKVLLGWRRS